MNKIEAIMRKFPQNTYDPEDTTSSLYKLISAIVPELDAVVSNIDRINDMVGIDTINDDDLYKRFGSLLNIKKNESETFEQYRNRLKTSITALSGGTADAIRYAIACGLGINDDPTYIDKIKIYDAWEYDGPEQIYDDYGYVVCTIDLDNGKFSSDMENTVRMSANNVKAAGVIVQFIYKNYRIVYYDGLDNITYSSLDSIEYDKVGE